MWCRNFLTSCPFLFQLFHFFIHVLLTTKLFSNITLVLEVSPLGVSFLREICPSPVHCPFWRFAFALLKQHVVLLNFVEQQRKFLLRVHRPIPCFSVLDVEHCACPNFTCSSIIRIKVKASPASTASARFIRSREYRARGRARRIYPLQRATSGCAANPIACTAGGHPGRT